ncbi:MAG: TetR/AcrR family transcriptional regulator [Salinibacter sp.]
MSSPDASTEAQILEAARTVFVRRGTHAASLKEIAQEADVNQALLHYYFRDKKTLADTVFEEVASEFIPQIQEILTAEQAVEAKVETVVEKYIELIRENPYLPSYIVGELNQNPEEMKERIRSMGLAPFDEIDKLDEQLQAKAEAGELRPISAEQFVVNLLSLCIFPFVACPLIETIFDMDDDAFGQFIDERKEEIPEFVLRGLRT